jgi:hypothetical protein
MTDTKVCPRCEGCKQIANSEDGEPWTAWTSLPFESQVAVRMGLVRPLPCPECSAGPVFERLDELTEQERGHLAYEANHKAEWFNDPRYNGRWTLCPEGEEKMWPGQLTASEWEAQRPLQLENQARWRKIAASLDPVHYNQDGFIRDSPPGEVISR